MKKKSERPRTLAEEIANSITHGIGLLLSIAGLVTLVVLAEDPRRTVSFVIYGSTLVALYLASTLYHGIQSPKAKNFFHLMDHSAIYLLIAGSYTPFTLITLGDGWGWALFGVIWGCALCGILMKLVFSRRFRKASTAFYVLMGWMSVVAIKPLFDSLPATGFAWLVAGGAFYTLGVLFYVWKSRPFAHTVWHVFVLCGSLCHFLAIFGYVLPINGTA